MSQEYLTICWRCKLVYRPDPRQHVRPHEFCPRCGFPIHEGDKLWKGAGYDAASRP